MKINPLPYIELGVYPSNFSEICKTLDLNLKNWCMENDAIQAHHYLYNECKYLFANFVQDNKFECDSFNFNPDGTWDLPEGLTLSSSPIKWFPRMHLPNTSQIILTRDMLARKINRMFSAVIFDSDFSHYTSMLSNFFLLITPSYRITLSWDEIAKDTTFVYAITRKFNNPGYLYTHLNKATTSSTDAVLNAPQKVEFYLYFDVIGSSYLHTERFMASLYFLQALHSYLTTVMQGHKWDKTLLLS